MKTMSKSAKKFFAAAACMGMLLVCFAGCNQLNGGGGATEQQNPNNPSNSQKSSEKKLIEFMFEKANNAGLSADVKGSVNEKNRSVMIEVPSGTDKTKLKASFKISDKAQLSIGSTVLESGKTENDFSNITDGVKLTVKAEDGTTQEYTVKVYGEVHDKIRITQFGFKQTDNTSALSKDVNASYTGFIGGTRGVSIIQLPVGTTEDSLKTLKPSFTTNSPNVELFVKGTKLESGATIVDFSDTVAGTTSATATGAVIELRASDGGSRIYTAVVEIDLPRAAQDDVKKYFGSYKGTVPGLGEVVIVLAWDRITLYSAAMSMYYENMEWEKMPDNTYTCTAYKKNKPQIKGMYGKTDYWFTEEGGIITVKANIMGVSTTATKQAIDFVWTPECGYKKANPM